MDPKSNLIYIKRKIIKSFFCAIYKFGIVPDVNANVLKSAPLQKIIFKHTLYDLKACLDLQKLSSIAKTYFVLKKILLS